MCSIVWILCLGLRMWWVAWFMVGLPVSGWCGVRVLAVVGFLVFGFACFVVVVSLIVAGDDAVFGDLFSLGWLVKVAGGVVLEFAGLLGFRFRWVFDMVLGFVLCLWVLIVGLSVLVAVLVWCDLGGCGCLGCEFLAVWVWWVV